MDRFVAFIATIALPLIAADADNFCLGSPQPSFSPVEFCPATTTELPRNTIPLCVSLASR